MSEHIIDEVEDNQVEGEAKNEVAILKARVESLEDELRALRELRDINAADEELKLTYCDLGISSEDIFGILETYTLASASIHLTKERLAKIIQHHIVRGIDTRFRDARSFNEVLDLRVRNIDAALEKFDQIVGEYTDVTTKLELMRLNLAKRDLIYIRDAINGPISPCKKSKTECRSQS